MLTPPVAASSPVAVRVAQLAAEHRAEILDLRRRIHANPEVARTEHGTTALVADRLRAAGLRPRFFPGTGLSCDIGPSVVASGRRLLALRADLDALPVDEATDLPFRSVRRGISHACGHDVHTAAVLGAGLVLARMAADGELASGIRLVFQPAEEVHPGGAHDAMEAGVLEGVGLILALHCDPHLDVGSIGTRIGPITSASDSVTVTVTSPGGHTSRPHLTGDVVFALGQVITQVPAVLGRRLDPRSGVNLTWGAVRAGATHNAIPTSGSVRGTMRCLDARAWQRAEEVFTAAVQQVTAPYDVTVEVDVQRGVPPVENDADATRLFEEAATTAFGEGSIHLTEQSLGGEDFAWYLTVVPGALARLGTRTPGSPTYDLHQAEFRVDERAIDVGVRLLAGTALLAVQGDARLAGDGP